MPNSPTIPANQYETVPLPLRNDTILGVCEAIGRDFGFNPNWLRVLLSAIVLVSPVGALAAYAGLAIIVAAANLLFRDLRVPAAASGAQVAPAQGNDSGEAFREAA